MENTQTSVSIKDMLSTLVQALLNGNEYKINVGKLPESKIIVIDILVPSNKIGVMLGKRDEYGHNPTKIALYRLIRQVSFYQGFTDAVLTIDELKPEVVRA